MPFQSSRAFRVDRIALVVAFVGGLLAAPPLRATAVAAQRTAGVPVVRTSSGALSGIALQNMQAYLGIPYAKPPVGALRWEPPQAPVPWSGTRPAVAFGPHCAQGPSPVGVSSVTEDCLYLNVFAPLGTKPGAKLPVMVWIHGGAFVSGESDDYDPDRLVARNVIVVTLNYRLGYFGFLATSSLDAEPHLKANYGLLDQQYALAWTQRNIAAFGGDPARTTVFGQSAGGASTFAQILAPSSAGLFSRAIVQSGAYDILSLPSLATAEAAGNALVATLCAPATAACLRGLSVAQILALETGTIFAGPSPAIDGSFLPAPAEQLLLAGQYNHVPIVQGTNHDEFRFFTATLFDLNGAPPLHPILPVEYPAVVGATLAASGLGAATSAVLAEYPLTSYPSPDLAYSAFATDAAFTTPAFVTDQILAAQGSLYAYEFADENAPELFLPPVTFPYGAAHGSELPYIYDFFALPSALSSAQRKLAQTMVGYWTRFAARGNPNDWCTPLWTPYFDLADDMISLVPPRPKLFETFALEHNVGFWLGIEAARARSKDVFARRLMVSVDAARAAAKLSRGTR